jgi:hypothetical protein
MLTPFRSARSAKVPLFPLVLFAWVSAFSLLVAVGTSQARMDDPLPAPHLEGWPDPIDNHVAGDQTSLCSSSDHPIAPRTTDTSSSGSERDPSEHPCNPRGLQWLIQVIRLVSITS